MDATRSRFGPLLEWLLAAAFIVGALAAAAIAARDLQGMRAMTPVIAHEATPPEAPAVVPPRAVAVPVLPLPDGKVVQLGDRASQIIERLGEWAQIGTDSVERVAAGERITRFYEYAGARFALVLEARVSGAEPRVVAIYRQ